MSTNQKPPKASHPRDHKAFADHIGELRTRVLWVVLTFVITSAIAYNFRDILVQIVLAPLGDQKLIYLTPAGGFAFIFQITMYAAAIVSAPLLIYQVYRFVQPALPRHATRRSIRIVLSSVALMVAGVCFGYFVAVPAALHFLTAFAGSYVEASLTADSYLNFIMAYVVGLGLLFQLPLLLIFWNWINPLNPKKLLTSERFVILFAFIAAAMITPTPDPTNQAMIAVPIILIYQIGVVAVIIINRRQRRSKQIEEVNLEPGPLPEVIPVFDEEPAPVQPQPVEPEPAQTPVLTPEPVAAQRRRPRPRIISDIRPVRAVRLRPDARPGAGRLTPPSRDTSEPNLQQSTEEAV
jgi:sec-independent protein translocase protein TatC